MNDDGMRAISDNTERLMAGRHASSGTSLPHMHMDLSPLHTMLYSQPFPIRSVSTVIFFSKI